MFELAAMLLPIAAASGWYAASKYYKGHDKKPSNEHVGYFKGLNYLLNEQPDKAISVFIELLEVDDETIEIHLALGTLFRQRGEVEKSIRLHQNLIARPQINQQTRSNALNELGLDYMRAGLLDRAENIFLELEGDANRRRNAVVQLLSIFQQEKEWGKAVEYAIKLEAIEGEKSPLLLSHLYCELALMSKDQQDTSAARQFIKKSLRVDSACIRANVISAELAFNESNYKLALKDMLNIAEQDERFVPVFLPIIIDCFNRLAKPKKKFDFLEDLQARSESPAVMSYFIDVLIEQKGVQEASNFLHEKLLLHPSKACLKLYAELNNAPTGDTEVNFLKSIIKEFDSGSASFKCAQCGFDSVELNWCCPSCKDWGTAAPV